MTLITPFITTPYISRVLGADGTGVQSYTNSVVQYFAILAALGTASYGQREIARHRDDIKMRNRLFWEIEALCMATTAACLMIWLFVIGFASEIAESENLLLKGITEEERRIFIEISKKMLKNLDKQNRETE